MLIKMKKMPQNKFQRLMFALITVIITVHAYVFYSLYVVNGNTLMEINQATSVIGAINKQGGVMMCEQMLPIWAIVLVEFCLAYSLEVFVGQPISFKCVTKIFNMKETHPVIFETAIICATVGIMCPAMSFLAAFLYYPYYAGFNIFTLFANWIKLVCFNFPFAFFSQLFFIQPTVRKIFKLIFVRNSKKDKQNEDSNSKEYVEAK